MHSFRFHGRNPNLIGFLRGTGCYRVFQPSFPPPPRQLSHSPSTLPAPPAPPHPLRRALFPPQAVRQKGKKRPSEFRDEMFPNLTKKKPPKKKKNAAPLLSGRPVPERIALHFPLRPRVFECPGQKKKKKRNAPHLYPPPVAEQAKSLVVLMLFIKLIFYWKRTKKNYRKPQRTRPNPVPFGAKERYKGPLGP